MSDFPVVPFPQKLPSKTTEDCNQRHTNTNTEMDMNEVPNYPDNPSGKDTVEVPTLVNNDIEANAVAVNNHENFADFLTFLNTFPPNAMSATMNSNNDATMNSGNSHSSNAEPVSNCVENEDTDNPENTLGTETVEVNNHENIADFTECLNTITPNAMSATMNSNNDGTMNSGNSQSSNAEPVSNCVENEDTDNPENIPERETVEFNNHENIVGFTECLNTIPPNAMSATMNSNNDATMNSGNSHSSNAEPVSNCVENEDTDNPENIPETETVEDLENTPAYLTLTANVVEVNSDPAIFSDSDDVNMSPPQYESEDVDMLPP